MTPFEVIVTGLLVMLVSQGEIARPPATLRQALPGDLFGLFGGFCITIAGAILLAIRGCGG